ncbi:hypothetical protein HN587_02020 [Candidatus Woesearchaeota archaeon]|jgi:hypothetical protein|nr:hypothetical protein [Candidatus Woesearchaeota archaeon]
MHDDLDRFFGGTKTEPVDDALPKRKSKAPIRRLRKKGAKGALDYEIPRSLFYEIGSEGCLVVIGQQSYVPAVPKSKLNAVSDRLSFAGRQYELIESESLEGMIDLYRVINSEVISSWGEGFVDELLAKEFNVEDVSDRIKQNQVLDFVVNQIFSHYLGMVGIADDERFAELVGDSGRIETVADLGDNLDIIEDYIGELTKQLAGTDHAGGIEHAVESFYTREKDVVVKAPSKNVKLIQELVGSKNFMIFNGGVYVLHQEPGTDFVELAVGGRKYGVELVSDVETFESELIKQLKTGWQVSAIQGSVEKFAQLKGVKRRKLFQDVLTAVESGGSYEIPHGVGIQVVSGEHYLTMAVPEHVLYHRTTKKYFKFDACHVGVRVSKTHRGVHLDHPVIIEKYEHKFVQGKGRMQRICLDQSDRFIDNSTSKALAISYLETARNVLLTGLGKALEGSHWHYLPKTFRHREISKSEMERQGLEPTNLMTNYD